MFRKMLMVAVPAMACAMTLFVTDNGSSQAFANGGRGVRGYARNHHGYGRYFRNSYRYGTGYKSYGYFGCEAPVYEVTTPVCTTCEPVAAPPVCTTCEAVVAAPVCTTCEPSDVGVESQYSHSWGHRHFRSHPYNHGGIRPLTGHGVGRRG